MKTSRFHNCMGSQGGSRTHPQPSYDYHRFGQVNLRFLSQADMLDLHRFWLEIISCIPAKFLEGQCPLLAGWTFGLCIYNTYISSEEMPLSEIQYHIIIPSPPLLISIMVVTQANTQIQLTFQYFHKANKTSELLEQNHLIINCPSN